ncbi:hypothetical protein B0T19DRAFT_439818 [Cercophora scortea]|uniref:Uncharacterized protein n=1 Tax=Cercophora scortea TaxID=314031 RepID=A0AAE0MHP5_9PEZI|nr:hypothetical protein B0T19DRAFT_439818 [Cercophora scortea]
MGGTDWNVPPRKRVRDIKLELGMDRSISLPLIKVTRIPNFDASLPRELKATDMEARREPTGKDPKFIYIVSETDLEIDEDKIMEEYQAQIQLRYPDPKGQGWKSAKLKGLMLELRCMRFRLQDLAELDVYWPEVEDVQIISAGSRLDLENHLDGYVFTLRSCPATSNLTLGPTVGRDQPSVSSHMKHSESGGGGLKRQRQSNSIVGSDGSGDDTNGDGDRNAKRQHKNGEPQKAPFDPHYYSNRNQCGNCHKNGHAVIHCVKQTILGDIAACPFCNHDDHIGSDCGAKFWWWPGQKWDLCWNSRIGLPPLRLREDLFAEAKDWVTEDKVKGCPMTRAQARFWRENHSTVADGTDWWDLYDYDACPPLVVYPFDEPYGMREMIMKGKVESQAWDGVEDAPSH